MNLGSHGILTPSPSNDAAAGMSQQQDDEDEPMKDDVLIFSQILTAYDEVEQQRIHELQQEVATTRTALEAATASHKQLWEEIARLDKALALVENAVRARAASASS